MSENYWAFDRQSLLDLGVPNQMVESIASAVERNPVDYVTLNYAGDPNGNIAANFSLLCIDTTNDFLYYNLTVGGTTWTKVVV
jgi:hypothetical protein